MESFCAQARGNIATVARLQINNARKAPRMEKTLTQRRL